MSADPDKNRLALVFQERLRADGEAGETKSLTEYLKLFSGDEETIANESFDPLELAGVGLVGSRGRVANDRHPAADRRPVRRGRRLADRAPLSRGGPLAQRVIRSR